MMAAGIGALLFGLVWLIGTLVVFVWLWWRVLEKAGYPGWVAAAVAAVYVVLSIVDMVLGTGFLGLIGTVGIVALLLAFALLPWPRDGGKGLPFGPQPIPGAQGQLGQPAPYGAPSGYPAPPAGYPAPPPYGQPPQPGYPQQAQGPAGYGQPPMAPPPPSYGQPPVAPPPPSYGGQPPVAPPPPSYGGQPPVAPPPGGGEPEATVIGGRAMPPAGGPGPGAPPAPAAPAAGPGWALSTPGPGGAPFTLSMTDGKALYVVSGQGGGGDLIVPEASIGNPHARLHLAGGRLGLEDLGSPGGTAIDGAQLLPSHGIREVTQSKKIRFGALEFSLTRT